MKIGKEIGKREKGFPVSWARGVSAQRARSRTRPAQLGLLAGAAQAHVPAREGETALGGRETVGSVGRKNRSPELDGGSPPVTRFWVVGVVAKHG
jgi:hypothetical protein